MGADGVNRATRRRAGLARALVAVAAVGLAACATVIGVDGLEIGQCKGGVCGEDAGEPVDGEVDADLDAATDAPLDGTLPNEPCPGTHGPTMVRVGSLSNNFCIDSTEVTVAQYDEFVQAKGADTSGQPFECSWNTDYKAGFGGPNDVPVTGVDWCDARAYCAWAGKRLCGKVEGGKDPGVKLTETELDDFTVHQWLVACSAEGQLVFPYGSVRKAGACNLADSNSGGKTVAVKSMADCVGGYPGVYDMLGNAWEWFDYCRPRDAGAGVDAGDGGPAKMECLIKGGSFATPDTINCRTNGIGATRDIRSAEVGFRCCAP